MDLQTGLVKGPELVRVNPEDSILHLKILIAQVFRVPRDILNSSRCAVEKYSSPLLLLSKDDALIRDETFYKGTKVRIVSSLTGLPRTRVSA